MEEIKVKTSKKVDMLNGSLADKILIFALPIAASSILQQLFNAVDVAVVGHFASSRAQAAVGCNAAVINLLINLFVGVSIGSNVVIANYIGQRERDKISTAVHTSIMVAIISGILSIIIGNIFAKTILTIMDTPQDIMEQAILYLRLYFLGIPFILLYNFGSAILRSIGDTRRPLYCLALSGVVNVVLNIFLVVVFKLDVAGVAIATVVSNLISASMVLYFLVNEAEPIRLSLKKLTISTEELVKILKIGLPAGMQGVVFSISNMFIQFVINGFGSAAVAGSTVALNYEYCNYFVIASFNQAAVTFISQNLGAKNYDRCKRVFKICFLYGILISAFQSAIFMTFKPFFIGLFTSDAEVARYAGIRMWYIVAGGCLMGTYEITGSALRGLGYSLTPAILITFGICVLRIFWVTVVCPVYHTYEALLAIYPISWIVTGSSIFIAYFIIRRKVFANLEADK